MTKSEACNDNFYIHIKTITQSKKERVEKVGDNRFVFELKEKAENNEANKRIKEILNKIYPNKQIIFVKGQKAKSKTFRIVL